MPMFNYQLLIYPFSSLCWYLCIVSCYLLQILFNGHTYSITATNLALLFINVWFSCNNFLLMFIMRTLYITLSVFKCITYYCVFCHILSMLVVVTLFITYVLLISFHAVSLIFLGERLLPIARSL